MTLQKIVLVRKKPHEVRFNLSPFKWIVVTACPVDNKQSEPSWDYVVYELFNKQLMTPARRKGLKLEELLIDMRHSVIQMWIMDEGVYKVLHSEFEKPVVPTEEASDVVEGEYSPVL